MANFRMDRKLVVVGICHSLQCGCDPFTQLDIEECRGFVLRICKLEKIRFIAEEMSKDGLENYSVSATIFQELAAQLDADVKIAHVDMERELRFPMGIDDYRLRRAAILDGCVSPDREIEALYNRHLVQTIRECSWLARIVGENAWPAILICGPDHVRSIANRARKIGLRVKIASYDYRPESPC